MEKVNGLVMLAEKLAKNEISSNDPKMVEASKLIAKMATTEKGRDELAEIVKVALEDSYNKFDIIPLLFDTKHFNLGDKPMFKTHKKELIGLLQTLMFLRAKTMKQKFSCSLNHWVLDQNVYFLI